MELIYFILSVYGISGFLAIINHKYLSKINRDARGRFTKDDSKRIKIKILECPFCMGFWVGLLLFSLNGYTNLFNFDLTFLNAILLPFVSAGTTYVLGTVIDDGGIRIDNNCKYGNKGYN